MTSSEKPVTGDDKGGWIYVVGPLGIIVALVSDLTDSKAIGAVAIAMLFSAGITGVIQMIRGRKTPAPTPPLTTVDPTHTAADFEASPLNTPTYASTSLVGVRIRHIGGISVVTEDLDTPMPRRTVVARDTHGRPERLFVSVDEWGRVVEAAIPGSEWAAAESI